MRVLAVQQPAAVGAISGINRCRHHYLRIIADARALLRSSFSMMSSTISSFLRVFSWFLLSPVLVYVF
jgi:hypothetical protein